MAPDRVEEAARRYVPGVGAVSVERLGRGLVNESHRVLRDGRMYSLRMPAAQRAAARADRCRSRVGMPGARGRERRGHRTGDRTLRAAARRAGGAVGGGTRAERRGGAPPRYGRAGGAARAPRARLGAAGAMRACCMPPTGSSIIATLSRCRRLEASAAGRPGAALLQAEAERRLGALEALPRAPARALSQRPAPRQSRRERARPRPARLGICPCLGSAVGRCGMGVQQRSRAGRPGPCCWRAISAVRPAARRSGVSRTSPGCTIMCACSGAGCTAVRRTPRTG